MQCYCDDACPPGSVNNTCLAAADGWCFASVTQVYNHAVRGPVAARRYGCLQPRESGYMQCQGKLVTHKVATGIECCRNASMCNVHLKPQYHDYADIPVGYMDAVTSVTLLVSVCVCLATLCTVVLCTFYRYKKTIASGRRGGTQLTLAECSVSLAPLSSSSRLSRRLGGASGRAGRDMVTVSISSGSGVGKPLLTQRTVAREISLLEQISGGQYSRVYRAIYQGLPVAVKVFDTLQQTVWQREKFVYETCRLQHANILGFIAADLTSSMYARAGSVEMWLITDYHTHGSLRHYISCRVLSVTETARMALSIVQGLDYLHKGVFATSVRPAVAHRDIRSANILVKADGQCCLADLGMSVVCHHHGGEHSEMSVSVENYRCGAVRYLPPEVLAGSQDTTSFQAHKWADVYSLALVFWELASRCALYDQHDEDGDDPSSVKCRPYSPPYGEYEQEEPSLKQMHEFVCVEQLRPTIELRWTLHPVLLCLAQLMQECWRHAAESRLSAMYVKKRLLNVSSAAGLASSGAPGFHDDSFYEDSCSAVKHSAGGIIGVHSNGFHGDTTRSNSSGAGRKEAEDVAFLKRGLSRSDE